MPIQVQCHNERCGASFECSPSERGTVVSCPRCQRPVTAPQEDSEAPLERQLGDYRLVRLIAKGGMGEVYEAVQTSLDRKVALKILSSDLAGDPSFIKRFEREAKSAAKINHANLVQVYDFGRHEDVFYLAMELADGEDLAQRVEREGPFNVEDALIIAENVALALQEAHANGIIHRDIKPANILITRKGIIKVSDLGLARGVEDDADLTATGIGIGSPHFIAPEQAEDASKVDHRCDIYSLGITLLFLLTGRRPYEGKTAFSIAMAHVNKPLPTGRDLGVDLPEPVEKLIRWMSAKDRNERYPDYQGLIADIQRLRNGEALLGPAKISASGLKIASSANSSQDDATIPDFEPPSPPPHSRGLRRPASSIPKNQGAKRHWQFVLGIGVPLILLGLFFLVQHLRKNPVQFGNSPENPANGNAIDPSEPLETEEDILRTMQELLVRPGGGTPNSDGTGGPPFPLPPMKEIADPLPDGTVEEMLQGARFYAEAHPNAYRNIVARFEQVVEKARGSAAEKDIKDELDQWKSKHQAAGEKEYLEFLRRMVSYIRSGSERQAMGIWQYFPDDLRSPPLDQRMKRLFSQLPTPPGNQGRLGEGRQDGRPPPPRSGPSGQGRPPRNPPNRQ